MQKRAGKLKFGKKCFLDFPSFFSHRLNCPFKHLQKRPSRKPRFGEDVFGIFLKIPPKLFNAKKSSDQFVNKSLFNFFLTFPFKFNRLFPLFHSDSPYPFLFPKTAMMCQKMCYFQRHMCQKRYLNPPH